MIDRLRDQIKERLDQLAHEADRLRKALAALGPGPSKPPASKAPATRRTQPTKPAPAASTTKPTSATTKRPASTAKPAGTATTRAAVPRSKAPATASPRKARPGATKAAVLAALAGGEAMTASEVAAKAGLPRPTVSTTLTRLAKSGEVQRAARGYRLGTAAPSSPAE